jgi:hypothetical protein
MVHPALLHGHFCIQKIGNGEEAVVIPVFDDEKQKLSGMPE